MPHGPGHKAGYTGGMHGVGGHQRPPPTKDPLQDPVHSNLVTAGKPGARQTMLHPQRAGGTVVREFALNRTPFPV